MKNIKNFTTGELKNPKFIYPMKLFYEEDGVNKEWEAIKSHDSVSVLLYHRDKKAFLLVKQFRAAVYNNNKTDGITFELCAGIIDKNLDEFEIIREEIDEECGFDVELKNIERISSFYTAVGFSGGLQTLFYAEIDESMKIHEGGGIDNEMIELYFLKLEDAKKFVTDETKPKTPGLMFSIYWFFDNKIINDRNS